MRKLLTALTLSAALLAPGLAIAQNHPDDRGFYDKNHKDYHKWDDHEDKAWHIYQEQHHRKNVDWKEANARDQQAYWNWRHNHSDALLKIDIR